MTAGQVIINFLKTDFIIAIFALIMMNVVRGDKENINEYVLFFALILGFSVLIFPLLLIAEIWVY